MHHSTGKTGKGPGPGQAPVGQGGSKRVHHNNPQEARISIKMWAQKQALQEHPAWLPGLKIASPLI